MVRMMLIMSVALLCGCASTQSREEGRTATSGGEGMQLGNFSLSLSVKDIAASRAFYEKLGFGVVGGDQLQKWLVLQNGTATIGIFQGMFQGNMLTFNPGWDREKNTLKSFDDVRDIQAALESKGITMLSAADPRGTGPASIVFTDPDGNVILVDQHVSKPGS